MQFAHRYPCYSIHFLLLHYSVVGITTKLSCTMHFFQAVLFMANEISDKCTFVLISRNQLKRKSSQILITDYVKLTIATYSETMLHELLEILVHVVKCEHCEILYLTTFGPSLCIQTARCLN